MDILTKEDCTITINSVSEERLRSYTITGSCKDGKGGKVEFGIYGHMGFLMDVKDVRPYYELKKFAKGEAQRFIDRLPKKMVITRPKELKRASN